MLFRISIKVAPNYRIVVHLLFKIMKNNKSSIKIKLY